MPSFRSIGGVCTTAYMNICVNMLCCYMGFSQGMHIPCPFGFARIVISEWRPGEWWRRHCFAVVLFSDISGGVCKEVHCALNVMSIFMSDLVSLHVPHLLLRLQWFECHAANHVKDVLSNHLWTHGWIHLLQCLSRYLLLLLLSPCDSFKIVFHLQ